MPDKTEVRIIRSARRKHVAFRIGADGVVEIIAPENVPELFLHQILSTRPEIIEKLQKNFSNRKQLDFSEGANFLLLGKPYPLHLTHRLRLFDHAFMIPNGSDQEKKSSMITLYRELAKEIIIRKVTFFQSLLHVAAKKININAANTRWGSCSGKKTLSFSWKLIQCPESLVDYVIVHELCHLNVMNHSPAFWKEVATILPDYKIRRAELNAFARNLPCW